MEVCFVSQVRKKAQDVFFNCQELSRNSKKEMMSLILPNLKEDPNIPHYRFKVRYLVHMTQKVRNKIVQLVTWLQSATGFSRQQG